MLDNLAMRVNNNNKPEIMPIANTKTKTNQLFNYSNYSIYDYVLESHSVCYILCQSFLPAVGSSVDSPHLCPSLYFCCLERILCILGGEKKK